MAKDCIISIDQGTTGSRVYVFDSKGEVLAQEYEEFRQYYPQLLALFGPTPQMKLRLQTEIRTLLGIK